jgi:superfamily I DNA and/or RNA helicase
MTRIPTNRHEHLYESIEPRVIRSDTLSDDIVGVERKLGGARVILCTLSTMSNFFVQKSGVMRLVPVQTVVVDEASQIEVGDYVPLIQAFSKSLKKLVFIGDDKQRKHPLLV